MYNLTKTQKTIDGVMTPQIKRWIDGYCKEHLGRLTKIIESHKQDISDAELNNNLSEGQKKTVIRTAAIAIHESEGQIKMLKNMMFCCI